MTGHLNNLDYTLCIESQPGYCGIIYNQGGEDLATAATQSDKDLYIIYKLTLYCNLHISSGKGTVSQKLVQDRK